MLAPVQSAQAQAQRGLPDFTDLYEKNAATVVSIETRQKVRRSGGGGMVVPPGADENDPFFDFFRRFGPRGGQGQQRDRDIEIPGSGLRLHRHRRRLHRHQSPRGRGRRRSPCADQSDKREFRAKVIGSDKRTDTALIKIEAKDMPKVTIGDPNKLKVGEWVIAIGQPFGLESTMTAGILSAKQRDIPGGSNDLVPFLQSDVAINPGNSGGPLFNMRGEVVGINSMIFSRSGGYQGVAFSIPIDVAMSVAEQLRETGKVRRSRIGVADRTGRQGQGRRVRADARPRRAGQRGGQGLAGGEGRNRAGRHRPQVRRPQRRALDRSAADRHADQARHARVGAAVAQGRQSRCDRRRRGDEGRRSRRLIVGAARGRTGARRQGQPARADRFRR